MSKNTQNRKALVPSTDPQIVDWSNIHWFQGDNTRVHSFGKPLADMSAPDGKEGKEYNTGIVRLLDRNGKGWDGSQGSVKVYIPTADDVKRAIADRERMIAELEATADTRFVADVCKDVWFPDGKPCDILAIGNEAYRRGYAIAGVLYRRKAKQDFSGDLSYPIPVLVTEFDSLIDRLVDHARENTQKTAGRAGYDLLDYAKLASRLFQAGGKEADVIRAGVSKGTAQKVWRFVKLHFGNADLKLLDRAFLPEPAKDPNTGKYPYAEGGYVRLDSLDKEALQRLLEGKDPYAKDSKEADVIDVTADVIEDYIRTTLTQKRAKERNISREVLENFAKHPCKVVAYFATAVLNDDKDYILRTFGEQRADVINDLLKDVVKKPKHKAKEA